MTGMIYRIEDSSGGNTIEFDSYCRNGIAITIKNADTEMIAYARDEDLLETINSCMEYAKKRTAKFNERQQKLNSKKGGNE